MEMREVGRGARFSEILPRNAMMSQVHAMVKEEKNELQRFLPRSNDGRECESNCCSFLMK